SNEADATNIQITVKAANSVASLFTLFVPEQEIPIAVRRKHESDSEVITWWQGTILNCDFKESTGILICQPTGGRASRNGLNHKFQITCPLQTYSTRCGVNVANFTITPITITSITGLAITVSGIPAVDGNGFAITDGYYNGGYIQN